MERYETRVDQLARTLAAGAGHSWGELNDYPGYTKNYWRAEARLALARDRQTAVSDSALAEALERIRALLGENALPPHVSGDLTTILAAAAR